MNTMWLAFITGLTTGGISCLAVQGGLLTSAIGGGGSEEQEGAEGSDRKRVTKWTQVLMFLAAKLAAYTLLGALLGGIGVGLSFSPKTMGLLQIAVGIFMLGTAGRLLNLHPVFRYFAVQPPKFVYKFLKKTSKSGSYFAPALLGIFTILMPCGVTQAMMAGAVASGNAITGAGLMFAFVLGTSPVFFMLGAAVTELLQRKAFAFAAATIVCILGVLSINGGMGLRGSFYTIQNIWKAATTDVGSLAQKEGSVAGITNGVQKATITIRNSGYTSDVSTLKVGVPLRLTLKSIAAAGCGRAFTIPDYNISKVLPVDGEETIEFTPKKIGRLAYSCSMGMYTGEFAVVN